MKIAWVSDIHGNLTALEAVDADLTREGVDVVVNLGDALSGPLLALDTARWLMAHTTSPAPGQPPWLHITGNHERQLLGADVALCHGTPANDLTYLLDTPDGEATVMATDAELAERLGTHVPDNITLLACGHTHLARHLTLARPAGSLQLVNPGSVGLPAYDDDSPHPRSSYHRVENGCPDARYALTERTPGTSGWKVSLHSVPYDFEPMARQADRRGRPDWAHALRTGRMPRPTA